MTRINEILVKLESLIQSLVELEIQTQGLAESYMPPELSIIGMALLSSGTISSGTHMVLNCVDGVPSETSNSLTTMLSIDEGPVPILRWHVVLDGEILAERDQLLGGPWTINQEAIDEAIERGELSAHLALLKATLVKAVETHAEALDRALRILRSQNMLTDDPAIQAPLQAPSSDEGKAAHMEAQDLITKIMLSSASGKGC